MLQRLKDWHSHPITREEAKRQSLTLGLLLLGVFLEAALIGYLAGHKLVGGLELMLLSGALGVAGGVSLGGIIKSIKRLRQCD